MNSKTRRFIVVDDSESTAQLLKSALRAVGPCTIDDARNGQIAYDKIVAASEEGKPYDLVLCDINMPVMDGLQLLEQCRSEDKLRTIPFLIITTESAKPTVIRSVMAGISGYVVKPFEIGEIKSKVESILRSAEVQNETRA